MCKVNVRDNEGEKEQRSMSSSDFGISLATFGILNCLISCVIETADGMPHG